MDSAPNTTIVVPCFNEARRLDHLAFTTAIRDFDTLSLLFVDDGSTDETVQLLRTLCREHPDRMDCLALPENGGKAEAVRLGILHALQTEAVFVGFWDADLSTPLDQWLPMCRLAQQQGAQAVLGSRVKLLGRDIERKALRHYVSRVFATFTSLTLGLPVYDTQCGAKVFPNCQLIREVFETPFGSRWIFDVEFLARLVVKTRRGQTLEAGQTLAVEYPLPRWVHADGSKLKMSDYTRAVSELVRIAAWMRRNQ